MTAGTSPEPPSAADRLPKPHGGRLVDTRYAGTELQRVTAEFSELPSVTVELDQIHDAAKIAVGAYSPLDGFMDEPTLESVLLGARLPDGEVWPIPILLSPPGEENGRVIARLRPGDEVGLRDPTGRPFGVLELRSKYVLPRRDVARGTYGTVRGDHPNVARLYASGETALAGRVRQLREPVYDLPECELSPSECRDLLAARGWQHVAGYQTRNVPHRGHEQLQRLTLEREEIDGLLIHPLVGSRRAGEYRPQVVRDAYRAMIRSYLPEARVVFATLTIPMRYAGPRAALFFAIVRKNFGCSHYIVGRDQAGIKDFYDPYACHRIFDAFPIGVTPIRYRELAYCRRCEEMVSERSCAHGPADRVATSQTIVREALLRGRPLPVELLRPEVVRVLSGPASSLLIGPVPGTPTPRDPPDDSERPSEAPRIDPIPLQDLAGTP